ncbi:MAG: cyclodeaminase/cyclohydrolase family protein [Sciscionella sp.]
MNANRPEQVSLLNRSLREFLDEVAAPGSSATGGTVAAITTAAAAGLTAMVAGLSESPSMVRESERLRCQATALAVTDGEVYQAVLAAVGRPAGDPGRLAALHGALVAAAAPPRQLCEVAAQVAGLGSGLASRVKRSLAGDAVTACVLAAAAAHSAATLVRINLVAAGAERDEADAADRTAAKADEHAATASRPYRPAG